jgi:hypothetical protein
MVGAVVPLDHPPISAVALVASSFLALDFHFAVVLVLGRSAFQADVPAAISAVEHGGIAH